MGAKGLLTGLLLVGLAYYMYEPVPVGWKQPWKTRVYFTACKVSGIIGKVANAFGVAPEDFYRYVWDSIAIGQSYAHLDDVVETMKTSIEGMEVCVYRRKDLTQQQGLPGLVYFHGGGWVVGSIAMVNTTIKRMVYDTGAVAIAMNYRLAPEDLFPIGINDAVAVTKHFFNHADQYGVDRSRIVFSGDSAGGHLTFVVAMKLKAENFQYAPKLLASMYPATQAIDLQTPSYQSNANDVILATGFMAFFYTLHSQGHLNNIQDFAENKHVPKAVLEEMRSKYMPVSALPQDDILKDYNPVELVNDVTYWNDLKDTLLHPDFSPLFAPEEMLQGLPPSYMIVCQNDVLRDDGLWFAKRLEEAGVDVVLGHRHCFHGFALFTEELESAQDIMRDMTTYIRKHV